MDEKTESLIERGASLLIGLVLLLVGLLTNIDDKAQTILLAIAIPLISLATGIQLLNSLPHAIVNARNYVKNSGREEVIQKEVIDNTTEIPLWLTELEEFGKQIVKVKEAETDVMFPGATGVTEEPPPEPTIEEPVIPLEEVKFPEEEPKPEDSRFPGQEPAEE